MFKPRRIGFRERVRRRLIVTAIRIDCAEHDIILQHHFAIKCAEIDA